MKTLAILVGTRNRLGLLKQCLEALIGKIAVEHEIIVVDAGSTDGSVDYVRQLPDIRLVCDGEPIGQARSLNRVFRTLASKYACWISDDNVVQPGAMDLAVNILEQHSDIGMVALKVKDVMGPAQNLDYIGALWPTGILTCNQGLIRTRLLRDTGYFDEAFRDYGIDVDLTAKVLLADQKVTHTKIVAIHHYRDHQNAPGAIENDQRKARFAAAVDLYRRKYAVLLPHSLRHRLERILRQAAWFAVQVIRKLSGSRTVMGYTMLDWQNVFHSRYISAFDVWHNRNNPFYLVQHIPSRVSDSFRAGESQQG